MKRETKEKTPGKTQIPEFKEEKTRKILLLFAVLIFFGCTYYYFGNGKLSFQSVQILPKTKTGPVITAKKIPENNNATVQKTEKTSEQPETVKIPKKSETKLAIKKNSGFKYKPSGKSYFANIAGKSSGKYDPFSFRESKFIPFAIASRPAFIPGTNNLPSMPGDFKIPDAPPVPEPEEIVSVKGFIGKKAVVKINGITRALSENQEINNIKILNINPDALSVKFEIEGKLITKTMKSLSAKDNQNIQFVKYEPLKVIKN